MECGRLLESLDGAGLAEDALDQTLHRIEDAPVRPEKPQDLQWLLHLALPNAVVRYGIGRPRWLWPGVCISHIGVRGGDGWRAYLVRADANTTFPMHEHAGMELISVLLGAFHDGADYRAGDFAQHDAGTSHRQRVTLDGPCIALVAAETPARWRGAARVLGPLYGV